MVPSAKGRCRWGPRPQPAARGRWGQAVTPGGAHPWEGPSLGSHDRKQKGKVIKKWHLFPSEYFHVLGCRFGVRGCSQRRHQKAAWAPQQSSAHGGELPVPVPGVWGCPGGCHIMGRGAGGQPPLPCLCARQRVRAILIPAVCFVLLSCAPSAWWLAVAGFMDGVAWPPSLSLRRPQPLGLRHSLFSLPPGAPRPPGGTPTAPPR